MALLLTGCAIPRNDAPIATGVPDGFVLARWVASVPEGRAERVTFAYRGARFPALVAFPPGEGRFPATVRTGDPHAEPPPAFDRVVIVVRPNAPPGAGVAMAKTLEEVDPARVTQTP